MTRSDYIVSIGGKTGEPLVSRAAKEMRQPAFGLFAAATLGAGLASTAG